MSLRLLGIFLSLFFLVPAAYRLLFGSYSTLRRVVAVSLAVVVGLLLGAAAAYFRGPIDGTLSGLVWFAVVLNKLLPGKFTWNHREFLRRLVLTDSDGSDQAK